MCASVVKKAFVSLNGDADGERKGKRERERDQLTVADTVCLYCTMTS